MSESFEDAMAFARKIVYCELHRGQDSEVSKWCDIHGNGNCEECTLSLINRLQEAHKHDTEQLSKSEYARGYVAGQRSMDADHAAVAFRLRMLRFDGGSHENLSKIAYAVYPCATGWTCESSKGLRDRLIDLLGGVHEHCCDYGRDCACGDSRARGVGEPAKTMTYDVLGNERSKAIANLRYIRDCLKGDSTFNSLNIADAIGAKLDVGDYLHESICDRLIYLLGGNEKCMEEADEFIGDVRRRADQSHKSSPISLENETGITDELRRFKGCINAELTPEMVLSLRAEINCIADLIDATFGRMCKQRDEAMRAYNSSRDALDKLTDEYNELVDECEMYRTMLNDAAEEFAQLQAKLDEYDKTHIELPKGKDGKHIRTGDTVQYEDGEPFEVTRIVLYNDDTAWVSDGDEYGDMSASQLHHVDVDGDTAETIERLVREHTLGNLTEWELVDQIREAMDGRR